MSKAIGILFLLAILFSCSSKSPKRSDNKRPSNTNWISYRDTIPSSFILTFKYPEILKLADIIDNCRSVGTFIKNKDSSKETDTINTRQWNICMVDTVDYSAEYLINSWREIFNEGFTETRDTLTISNLKAIRVILKSKTDNGIYRQLIYFKKFATLFEVYNIHEATSKDFETFYKSIAIKEFRKQSH